MLADETQETIARFIGLLSVEEHDPKVRTKVEPASANDDLVEFHRLAESDDGFRGGGSTPPASNPHLRYANDHFEIVDATTARLAARPVEVALDPLHVSNGLFPAPDPLFFDPALDRTVDRITGPEGIRGEHDGGEPVRDPTFAYREIPSDSLFAVYSQTNLLDDRDTLILDPDAQPLDFVDAVSRQFQGMIEVGQDAQPRFALPRDAADMQAALSNSAFADGAEGGHGPAGHDGVYVNNQPAADMPDLMALLASLDETDDADTLSTLHAGSNLLRNEAGVANIADLGHVSLVKGNWFETNSIRQINIHADGDAVEGVGEAELVADATQAWNVARFERIDATPSAHPVAADAPPFPSHYQVDIIEGDLQITNFLSQLNFTLDGDQIVLGTLRSSATLSVGGNEVTGVADLLKSLGSYDLVVIGGDVFEGNFIRQMNILSDRDRIVSEGAGGSDLDGSVRTGGNLLLNNASITNYGTIGDFGSMTPHMRDLVASFEARAASGTADLGADLAFVQSQNIKVLYIAGTVYEMNVVSQMNILDDSDTLLMSGGFAAKFLDTVSPGAAWSVFTGHNGLVNNASIVDVDDVSHLRFIGGEYYSDSMLLQAGLVNPGDDVMTFDVNSLAPELVAFMTDLHSDDGGSGHSFHHHAVDAHADGVGGILA